MLARNSELYSDASPFADRDRSGTTEYEALPPPSSSRYDAGPNKPSAISCQIQSVNEEGRTKQVHLS